jgi:hypothetical protein
MVNERRWTTQSHPKHRLLHRNAELRWDTHALQWGVNAPHRHMKKEEHENEEGD